jgi:hypothetical protein
VALFNVGGPPDEPADETSRHVRASFSGLVRITRADGTKAFEFDKAPDVLIELADEDEKRPGGELNPKTKRKGTRR